MLRTNQASTAERDLSRPGIVDKKNLSYFTSLHSPISEYWPQMKERSSFARRPRAGGGRGTFEIHSNSMMASRDSAWKEGRRRRRTDGRASSRFTHHGHIHLFGWAFARGNGDGEKWEGREGRNEGELFLHEPHPNESVGRPTRGSGRRSPARSGINQKRASIWFFGPMD